MISALIVWSSVAFALGFVAAWAASPALRAWVERPAHRFLAAVQHYDLNGQPAPTPDEPGTP